MQTIALDHPAGGGGASGTNGGDGGPGSGGNGNSDGGTLDGNRLRCSNGAQTVSLSVTQEVPSIMFAVDRSHSMGAKLGTSTTAATKFGAVSNAISSVVAKYTEFVQFGYVEFPGVNGNGNCSSSSPQTGCCAGGLVPLVPRGGNASQLSSQLASCMTQPNTLSCGPDDTLTPTGQALQKLAGQLTTGGYALVLTDGPPTCMISNSTSAGDNACDQTVNQITSMFFPSSGPSISTFIMGIGDISDDHDCLSTMASAGGHPRGTQSPRYPIATTEAQVGSEMADIVTSTICRLDVVAGQSFDPTRLEVDLNGTPIPPDSGNASGGWAFDATNKTIIIDGDQCTNFVATGPSHHVTVKACPDNSRSTFPSH